jgi:hypothetical protein
VLHANVSDVAFSFRGAPRAKFRQQYARVLTLWAGLARVNSTLPLHVLVSGEDVEHSMHLTELTVLRRQGVHVHLVPSSPIPRWASWNHRASFAKLFVFNMSLQLAVRLIYLDTDLVVLRNIDHLQRKSVRTPAVVFRGDTELLNTGLMVVEVRSQLELDQFWWQVRERFACRMDRRQVSLHEPGCHLSPERAKTEVLTEWGARDGGDQEIFIHWAVRRQHEKLYELPYAYNAYPWQINVTREAQSIHGPWCMRAYALHKITNLARKGVSAECTRFIRNWQSTTAAFIKQLHSIAG